MNSIVFFLSDAQAKQHQSDVTTHAAQKQVTYLEYNNNL